METEAVEQSLDAIGYLMASSFEIKNFRCFQSVRANDCRRINILIGENGGGKTALMEALCLAASMGPEIAIRYHQWRGFEGAVSGTARSVSRGLWGDLFHNYDFKRSVTVALHGSKAHTRELDITYHERNVLIPLSRKSIDSHWSPVTFSWKGQNNRTLRTVTPKLLTDGKIEIEPAPESSIDTVFYAANQTYSSIETVNRFSELSKQSMENEIIEHFKSQYPDIDDLTIEMNAGAPMVFAKLKHMPEKLPLNLISGGMNKLASILFGMPTVRDGIMFIDEIENGFYFRRFPQLWKSILHFADAYKVQVFAATHSIECLDAAADVAEEAPDQFSVIYAGKGAIRQFSGERFSDALAENIEIR
jgi:AAA15 family ATPase/GTPase